MHAIRVETTIQSNGILTVRDLPLHAGDAVEVIIFVLPATPELNPYSLRGLPIKYLHPTDSVAEADWDAA